MPRSPTATEAGEETRVIFECLNATLSERGLRPQVPRLVFLGGPCTAKYLEKSSDGTTHCSAI
eukprot:2979936-Prymnesium_polylepis.1